MDCGVWITESRLESTQIQLIDTSTDGEGSCCKEEESTHHVLFTQWQSNQKLQDSDLRLHRHMRTGGLSASHRGKEDLDA